MVTKNNQIGVHNVKCAMRKLEHSIAAWDGAKVVVSMDEVYKEEEEYHAKYTWRDVVIEQKGSMVGVNNNSGYIDTHIESKDPKILEEVINRIRKTYLPFD